MPEPISASSRAEDAHLLVVGATGTLLPAVHAATSRGELVTAVTRSPIALRDLARSTRGRVRPLVRDYEDPGLRTALAEASRTRPFTGALLYCPLASPTIVRTVVDAVPRNRPVVLLLTSAHAAPTVGTEDGFPWSPARLPRDSRPSPHCRLLVLGWAGGAGAARWHTAEEISAAALRVLDADVPRDAVLGEVRPWAARPR
ncbi:hypothetical protein ABZ615_18400 [Streptomyces sp. NPDC007325]|uniref:hypothetical protein n=1 Tax=Streptomyces sp. NPDC007325 TaxID=3154588 RepID=UPI00340E46B8